MGIQTQKIIYFGRETTISCDRECPPDDGTIEGSDGRPRLTIFQISGVYADVREAKSVRMLIQHQLKPRRGLHNKARQ